MLSRGAGCPSHLLVAQDNICFLCSKDTLLTHIQPGLPPARPGAWACSSPGEELVFPLMELHKVPSAHFSSLWRSLHSSMTLWYISHSYFCVIQLPDSPLCPTTQIIRMDRIGPSIDPWCVPLVTGLQLGSVPLILLAWLFSQFSVHLTVLLSRPLFLAYFDSFFDFSFHESESWLSGAEKSSVSALLSSKKFKS